MCWYVDKNAAFCIHDHIVIGTQLYELWTRASVPYKDMSNQKVWVSVVEGYRLPCPGGCSEEIYDIMQQCWHVNPKERPDFEDLTLHLKELQASVAHKEFGAVSSPQDLSEHKYMDLVKKQDVVPKQAFRSRVRDSVPDTNPRMLLTGDDTTNSLQSGTTSPFGTPLNSGNDINPRPGPIVPSRRGMQPSPLTFVSVEAHAGEHDHGSHSFRPHQSESDAILEQVIIPIDHSKHTSGFETDV